MVVRAVYDIDIRDGAFQKFNADFIRFQKLLKATPLDWREFAKAQQKGVKGFQELVALEVASIGKQKLLNAAHEAAVRLTTQQATIWQSISRSTKGAAGNIASMTSQLMKWTALTSVFTGLIGAGGLFGIDRLAQSVAGGRRSSLGLGVGYGEQKAFQTSFSRVVDPDSFLSNINEALHSAGGKASLFGAGLNRPGDLSGSTADVGIKFLERARAIAKASDPQFDLETLKSRGLDKHIGLQDFQRLRGIRSAIRSGDLEVARARQTHRVAGFPAASRYFGRGIQRSQIEVRAQRRRVRRRRAGAEVSGIFDDAR